MHHVKMGIHIPGNSHYCRAPGIHWNRGHGGGHCQGSVWPVSACLRYPLPAGASRLQRFAHFWLLVFKSFSRNKGPLRATALAYTTLLGLIPLLAVGFGVASSFLKENQEATREIIQNLVDAVVPQLQVLKTDTNKVQNSRNAESAKSQLKEGAAVADAETNLAVTGE